MACGRFSETPLQRSATDGHGKPSPRLGGGPRGVGRFSETPLQRSATDGHGKPSPRLGGGPRGVGRFSETPLQRSATDGHGLSSPRLGGGTEGGSTINHQLALKPVACRAEQLQILQFRASAARNGQHMIQRQAAARPAIRAFVAVFVHQLRMPGGVIGAQSRPLASFDLRRHGKSRPPRYQFRLVRLAAPRQKSR